MKGEESFLVNVDLNLECLQADWRLWEGLSGKGSTPSVDFFHIPEVISHTERSHPTTAATAVAPGNAATATGPAVTRECLQPTTLHPGCLRGSTEDLSGQSRPWKIFDPKMGKFSTDFGEMSKNINSADLEKNQRFPYLRNSTYPAPSREF